MADKIKSFFLKKKNANFLNAGKGYKLTDSTSTKLAPAEATKPAVRAEPTEEAKIAGQAALARLEAKKTDKPKFNTSYATIQARVKRELELERAQKNLQQENKEENAVLEEKKDRIEDPSTYAVTDVFFRCPYVSDEILPFHQWKEKIREFLYYQREVEDPALVATLIIRNCNKGKEKIDDCVEILSKYLENIIQNPDVEKYWKIRMSNRIFQEKVLPIEGALDFLKGAGFEQKMLRNNETEEEYLIWNPDKRSIEALMIFNDAVNYAEKISLEVDRNVQVLMPCQARVRNELPPSFYKISSKEIKKEQQLRTEAVERNQMLRTKAMREKDEQRVRRKYRFAVLRIKFPDGLILQGTFNVYDTLKEVLEFVTENLVDQKAPFSLMTPDGIRLTEKCFDKTLFELLLIPTAILEFCWDTSDDSSSSSSGMPTGYLKEEVLSCIQSI